jgi:hypothetical protein
MLSISLPDTIKANRIAALVQISMRVMASTGELASPPRGDIKDLGPFRESTGGAEMIVARCPRFP